MQPQVNEIFQDLAVLVNEQGTQLEDIESNLDRTAVSTKAANSELAQADSSQRSTRNKLLWLMLFFVVVFSLLLVVVIPR